MAKKSTKRDGSKSQAVRDILARDPKATPKTIMAELEMAGIQVSEATVNKVKYAKPSGKSRSKRGRPKGGTNLSEEIRKIINADHSATRPEIRARLEARGLKPAPALVNNVYVAERKKLGLPIVAAVRSASKGTAKPKAKATARKKQPTNTLGSELSASALLDAKQLVDQLGGIDSVREALDLLEQLQ